MAKAKGKHPEEKGKTRGRPPLFKKEYVEQVYQIALLGANDEEIATILGVSVRTILNWKNESPDFLRALNSGKLQADAYVVDSLYKRAVGYSHKAVKIFADPKTGKQLVVPYTEHFPPDTTACIFWLKNRRPKEWREKIDVMHDVTSKLAERIMAGRQRVMRMRKGGGKGEIEQHGD